MATEPSAQDLALEMLGDVLAGHMRGLVRGRRASEPSASHVGSRLRHVRPGEAPPPVLVALDGPGAGDLLDGIAPKLRQAPTDEDRWTVIHFDAWQFQRVQPPWWWLLEAFDRQIRADLRRRERARSIRGRLRRRARTIREPLRAFAWAAMRVATDPWAVGLVAAAAAVIVFISLSEMLDALKTTAGVAGWLTSIAALLLVVVNRMRRHVLLFSPGNEKAVLRASDPMAAFQERYRFLLHARPAPVAFLVENLDRCRAAYVVELLEGIQTLLKHRPEQRPGLLRRLAGKPAPVEPPLVAFLVAADEAWLCDSFVEVYGDLCGSGSDHGRPCGLAFLDKVFDHSLHLPTVPVMIAPSAADEERCSMASEALAGADQEIDIRTLVRDAERAALKRNGGPPMSLRDVRFAAVKRLGTIEDLLNERLCSDTTRQLKELSRHLDAAAEVWDQQLLRTAYCSQRTQQLLGGHEIDHDAYAICRLGLWTVLTLRWPLLARYLVEHPIDISCLQRGVAPPNCPEELAGVFADRSARQVAIGFPGQAELTPAVVRRYTVPVPPPRTRFELRDPSRPDAAPARSPARARTG